MERKREDHYELSASGPTVTEVAVVVDLEGARPAEPCRQRIALCFTGEGARPGLSRVVEGWWVTKALEGPFSAVSKPISAAKYSFVTLLRDLGETFQSSNA